MIVLSFLLILFGMFVLYKCSAKQISQASPNQQQRLIRFKMQFRGCAFICFLVAGSLLALTYGRSIGFVSWWILATPITFLMVLRINKVMSKPQKKLKN
ncbi:hypothetical protein AYL20_06555 [Acinetobacter venetianus]|uniref:DUF1634 domain-containing protein n=1 Tax=Acinetobacter venetianus TaxID=52133 RepID=A0A137XWH8_9GAMM|nr:hypothetical protein [Acinetobacter venetianus]KXO78032.1 hypothetical protein AYL20_06555 [Acinetobacter venetianus]KXZ73909.1 hypothetical protein AVENLUH5627_00332 [Acinetobacter venetianus]